MSLGGEPESRHQLDLGQVHAAMARAARCGNRTIQECVDGLVGNPGKLLRPSMVLLSWRSVRETADPSAATGPGVIRLAAAVELLHIATLVHDDVIDRAQLRRARPTVYASHGARTAILVGDLLFSAAFQLVADLADRRLAAVLADAIRAISESEILQMNPVDPMRAGYRQYLHQIIGKTAVLFAVSCRAGAELAGAEPADIQALQRGGYDLGLAFQVIDDILDFDADDRTTGKTPGRDLELGVYTLPVLAALKQAAKGSAAGLSLRAMLAGGPPRPEDAARVRDLVREAGGFDTAREWAGRYTARALREFGRLAVTPAREELIALTRLLLERGY
jgi:geranylgeranyl pyrophosphate synthase